MMVRQQPPQNDHQYHHQLQTNNTVSMYYVIFTILLLINVTSSFVIPTTSSPLCFSRSSSLPSSPSTSLSSPSSSSSSTCTSTGSTVFGSLCVRLAADATSGSMSGEESASIAPQTFREAEILGLRLMQQGQHSDALEVFQAGLKLPGSRTDILRTKTLSTSPVGGSTGGSDGRTVQTLDEFESQAAHYNIACAYAQLGKTNEAVRSLENAFKAGFDNYATCKADPDLAAVQRTKEFEVLMETYDPKKNFPFSLFSK